MPCNRLTQVGFPESHMVPWTLPELIPECITRSNLCASPNVVPKQTTNKRHSDKSDKNRNIVLFVWGATLIIFKDYSWLLTSRITPRRLREPSESRKSNPVGHLKSKCLIHCTISLTPEILVFWKNITSISGPEIKSFCSWNGRIQISGKFTKYYLMTTFIYVCVHVCVFFMC